MFSRIFCELIQFSELFRLLGMKPVCPPEIPPLSPGHFYALIPRSQLSTKPAMNCFVSEFNFSLTVVHLRETPMRLHHRSADRACSVFLRVPHAFVRNNSISLLFFPSIFTSSNLSAMKDSNSIVNCTQHMRTKQCSESKIHPLYHVTLVIYLLQVFAASASLCSTSNL